MSAECMCLDDLEMYWTMRYADTSALAARKRAAEQMPNSYTIEFRLEDGAFDTTMNEADGSGFRSMIPLALQIARALGVEQQAGDIQLDLKDMHEELAKLSTAYRERHALWWWSGVRRWREDALAFLEEQRQTVLALSKKFSRSRIAVSFTLEIEDMQIDLRDTYRPPTIARVRMLPSAPAPVPKEQI